ncbi:hypothetical protein EB796_012942 [Bugula neritina]|uniref:Uncharacterized protein n=1 Tax=Bugula neritina TaxID=10212 RepID=A0A7J7JQY6_BUGNE|nr:hypothetical protein EB796_012942 [Bugula neritina]
MSSKEQLDEFVKTILVCKSEHPGSNPGQGNYFPLLVTFTFSKISMAVARVSSVLKEGLTTLIPKKSFFSLKNAKQNIVDWMLVTICMLKTMSLLKHQHRVKNNTHLGRL